MAPRTIGELISILTSESHETFISVIEEIDSHPKDEIYNSLVYIKDKDIFTIRERLFIEFLEVTPEELLQGRNIYINIAEPISNLRKRYKASTCCDDIYYLAVSILEKKLHKDITKILLTSTSSNTPTITSMEISLIQEVHEMKNMLLEIRKENKEFKAKLNLVCTKLDSQNKVLTELKETEGNIKLNNTATKANDGNQHHDAINIFDNKNKVIFRDDTAMIPNNNTVNGYINNNNTTNTADNHIAKHEKPTRDKKALYSSKVIESCNENVGKNVEDNTANFTMVKSKKKAVFGTKHSGTHTQNPCWESNNSRFFHFCRRHKQ